MASSDNSASADIIRCPDMHNAGTDGQLWATAGAQRSRVCTCTSPSALSRHTEPWRIGPIDIGCARSASSHRLTRSTLAANWWRGRLRCCLHAHPPKSRELAWLFSAGRLRPPPPVTELSPKERGSRPRPFAPSSSRAVAGPHPPFVLPGSFVSHPTF